MASELPKATDLATMPDDSDTSTSSTESPAPATSSTTIKDTLVQPDQSTTQDIPSQHAEESLEQAGAFNAWLSQENEDDGANDWLASDDAVPEQTQQEETPNEAIPEQVDTKQEDAEQANTQNVDTEKADAEQAHAEQSETEKAEVEQVETEAVSKPKGPVAQHSSSRSFARTVSHEISFGDDDEGEWTLSRTDTDPFKFMPPSDRTNSFPAVPPAHSTAEVDEQHHLPSNQAMDVLEETEREVDEEEELYQQEETSLGLHTPRRGHSSSISIGGDIKSPEGQDSDERYEEGIPLIPHAAQETNEEPVAQENKTTGDLFEGEGDEDADFFSQVQGSESVSEEQHAPTLERKSTMQVLDSMNAGSVSKKSALEGTPEEDEEEDDSDSDSDDSEDKAKEEEAASAEPMPVASDPSPVKQEDIASKWEQAFADDEEDDDFLLDDNAGEEKQVDPAAFFGSDDEGFLEDEEPAADPVPAPAPVPFPTSRQASGSNPYMPQAPAVHPAPSPYAPVNQVPGVAAPPIPAYNAPVPGMTPFGAAPQYGQPAPPRPDMPKAQSFADKSKGGYHSPYDLPTDLVTNLVKPRKRASMQQLSQTEQLHAPVQPPPRSASVGIPAPPTKLTPPSSSHGPPAQQPGPPKPAAPGAQHKENFFEELPMTSRPRPSSRTSQRAASPARNAPPVRAPHVPSPLAPSFPNQTAPPSAPAMAPPPSEPYGEPSIQAPVVPGAGLVAPERVSPYAALTTSANHMPQPPSTSASRYSPAPGTSHTAPPAPVNSRYSPAPPPIKTHGSYGAVANSGPGPMLPHQPRTSSPLTHSETAHFEPRLSRVSSLPPTREVDEEDEQQTQTRSVSAALSPPPQETRFNPTSPPPPSYAGQLNLSPPKQAGPYAPMAASSAHPGFVPPPRAQTQSPSASFGHKQAQGSSDSTRRPSSAHSHSYPSPVGAKSVPSPYAPVAPAAGVSTVRTRGQSITMNMIAPTDGRENDELQRWKGVPIISWGVGGTVVTSFPKSVPRYGMNQAVPMIVRTPGEVKVQSVKDLEPLHEHVAKFPGPLRGKSKKKETISWLSAGIELLEKDLPDVSFHSQLSLEAKRAVERLLLWKIMRIFVENDGILEGNPTVEAAVRDVLSPGETAPAAGDDALYPAASNFAAGIASVTSMQADGVDVSTMDQVRHHLLRGDRDKAVWALVDKRLWGHAMLISHTVEGDLYKRVAQEFVRKEVNYPGHANESMAALYKILSGNFEDCVDELVPVHARAGLQLVSTEGGSGPSKDTLDGLDKWRETLSLVLSNRSTDDIQGLNALGSLLSSYGRAEAAHICFIFGRHSSIFGGLDDPNANFVLIGADHRQQSDQFAKETEALQLSEVYEYGLSLAGGALGTAGTPHLAAYKLEHAMTLAEYGHRDKAMQYCDAILTAMSAQTKRSPYHHHVLEAAVEDFMSRLKSAPKEESGSWMSKPSMNKVSDSMWNRFNKFVAGDDTEDNTGAAGDAGPFTRPSGEFSRSPSVSNFDVYGQQSPGFGMTPAQTLAGAAASSKYAPANMTPVTNLNPYSPTSQYTPGRSSMEQTPATTYGQNPYEPAYPGVASANQGDSYTPSVPQPESNDTGLGGSGLAPAAQITQGYSPAGYQPYGMPASTPMGGDEKPADSSAQGFQPLSYGYEPPQMSFNPSEQASEENKNESSSGGYEPPSFQPYGYEPPSYEPQSTADDDGEVYQPKKKSIMDDDDDDFPSMKPAVKSKSDKDRENEEMFRKAAEEDAKRAAAQQSSKKGWGFGGWFGGSKKAAALEPSSSGESSPGKPIRAKLGEASSFVYDPDLKRWVNKKPGAENTPAKTATPPPPRAGPRSVSGTPPPPAGTPPPPLVSSNSAPPPLMPPKLRAGTPELSKQASTESLGLAPPVMMRSVSNTSNASAPPSRPTTSMSNASSIDDLLSVAPRKAGDKKKPRKGRYVDVMAK